MRIDVRLFPLDKPARDGSVIPKVSFLEYTNSLSFKERLASKNFYGGSTHMNRNKSRREDNGGVVGEGDELLHSGNITHIIDDYYIKRDPIDNVEHVYAKAEVMDNPDEYEGKSKELIKTLTRLLKRGVHIPTSVVIKARWVKDVATHIQDIFGFDFTLSPGYNRSQIVNIEYE